MNAAGWPLHSRHAGDAEHAEMVEDACRRETPSIGGGRGQGLVTDVHVVASAVEPLLGLRHAVLRAGLPRSSAEFPGDHEPTTVHVAAERSGEVVGCLSLMACVHAGLPAFQLRGMAITPELAGRGIGRRLLAAAEAEASARGASWLWCNARAAAVGFYARHGWTVDSDEFDIPTAGPHRRMSKRLGGAPALAAPG